MKNLVLVVSLMGVSALATAGERAGLAESPAAFEVTRAAVTSVEKAQSISEIQVGDKLAATEAPVVVRLENGSSVAISPAATATFDSTSIALANGDIAASIPSGSTLGVVTNGLIVNALAANDSTEPTVMVVRHLGEGAVEIEALQGVASVATVESKQLGIVGTRDIVGYRLTEKGWEAYAPSLGQPGGDVTGGDDSAFNDDGGSDNDGAWIIPAAIVGIGGLGYVGYKIKRHNDGSGPDGAQNNPSFGGPPPSSPIGEGEFVF
jgi:hypothetical protein